jgi:hypothetical protein
MIFAIQFIVIVLIALFAWDATYKYKSYARFYNDLWDKHANFLSAISIALGHPNGHGEPFTQTLLTEINRRLVYRREKDERYENMVRRVAELESQLADTKADLEIVREDFRNTDNGWEDLGTRACKVLGMEWGCNNDEILKRLQEVVNS